MSREDRYADTRRLSQLLVGIAERAKADFAAVVEPLGLPVHLARAVLLLDTPAPMRELADRLCCDRSYITSLADQLEERDLIVRVPGEDRRVKLLSLTPDGIALRDRIADTVTERSMVQVRLTGAQRKALLPLLEVLAGDPDDEQPTERRSAQC